MKVRNPTWWLRKRCPVCDQGSALVLVACPTCSSVAVVCAEGEGSAYMDPHLIAAELVVDPDVVRCRVCAQTLLCNFVHATSAQIRAALISVDDYE